MTAHQPRFSVVHPEDPSPLNRGPMASEQERKRARLNRILIVSVEGDGRPDPLARNSINNALHKTGNMRLQILLP